MCQGSAADIMKLAMIQVHDALHTLEANPTRQRQTQNKDKDKENDDKDEDNNNDNDKGKNNDNSKDNDTRKDKEEDQDKKSKTKGRHETTTELLRPVSALHTMESVVHGARDVRPSFSFPPGVEANSFRRKINARMVLQIHDELLFEVQEEHVAEAKVLITSCMVRACPSCTIPLEVSVQVGKSWGSMREVT